MSTVAQPESEFPPLEPIEHHHLRRLAIILLVVLAAVAGALGYRKLDEACPNTRFVLRLPTKQRG